MSIHFSSSYLGKKAELVLKQPASPKSELDRGRVSHEMLAIIFMAIDFSNFTHSDGFGVDILFEGENEKGKCLNMQFTAI